MSTNALSNGASGVVSGEIYLDANNKNMYRVYLDSSGNRSSRICFPRLSGTYKYTPSYDSNNALFFDKSSSVCMEFYTNKQINMGNSFVYSDDGNYSTFEVKKYDYVYGSDVYYFHYCLEFIPKSNYYSINFAVWSGGYSNWEVFPICLKYSNQLTDSERGSFGYSSSSQGIQDLKLQTKEQFEKQIAEQKKQHDEAMDTSDSSKVGGIADTLVKSGNEKTKSLLYPIQWAISTAHGLANAPSTGIIALPGIFGSDSFSVDLTVFERNIPTVWFFIQNFIRFIISFGIIKGILSLFKGVDG